MNTFQYIIGYQFDNHSIASEIDQKISRVRFTFDHIHTGNALLNHSIGERILQHSAPFLLIITDNFLKDENCIYKLYELLVTAEKQNRNFILILAKAWVEDPISGAIRESETKLTSVGDILYYINYWQDKYLRLRKKHIGEETLTGTTDNTLKKVREIAAEVGELLHKIRNLHPIDYEDFSQDDYCQFFKLTQHSDSHEAYKKMAEYDEQDARIERQVQNIVTAKNQPADENENNDGQVEKILVETEEKSEQNSNTKNEIQDQKTESSLLADLKNFKEEHLNEQATVTQPSAGESVNTTEEQLPDTIIISTEEMDKSKNLERELSEKFGKILNDPPGTDATTMYGPTGILQEYRNRLIKDPDNVNLRLELVKLLIEDPDNFSETADHLEHILVIDKENTEAIFLIGRLSESVGEHQLARTYFNKLAALQPDYPGIFVKLAEITEAHFPEEHAELSNYYKKAFDHDTTRIDLLEKRGVLLYKSLNKAKKAKKIFQKLIKWNPLHPTAGYYLADIYFEAGQLEKATETFAKAKEITSRLTTETQTPTAKPSTEIPVQEPVTTTPHDKKTSAEKLVTSYVCITGATSGIGKATAIKLASKGNNLILTGRREDRLEDLAEEIEDMYDVQVETLVFDIRNEAETTLAIQSLGEKAENIEILINNAGLAMGLAPIHEGNIQHWNTMIDTNIKGLLFMTRLIAPAMVRKNKGHIINICSTAGKEAYPNGNVYCATKFAVDALTKSFRQDLYKYNIRVSQVAPGAVENTEFALVRFEGDADKAKIYNDFNPLKSDDIANIIDFIISQPANVNIQDVLVMATQQASAVLIDRSGRKFDQ